MATVVDQKICDDAVADEYQMSVDWSGVALKGAQDELNKIRRKCLWIPEKTPLPKGIFGVDKEAATGSKSKGKGHDKSGAKYKGAATGAKSKGKGRSEYKGKGHGKSNGDKKGKKAESGKGESSKGKSCSPSSGNGKGMENKILPQDKGRYKREGYKACENTHDDSGPSQAAPAFKGHWVWVEYQ